jgi:YfiH family protein
MTSALHPDWLVPDWPAPAGVRAVCTTRAGGVSSPPYDSLNLGSHVGDESTEVAHNRGVLAQALGTKPVWMNQVHGSALLQLQGQIYAEPPTADGAWTATRGPVCTVMVADCLPVLLCSADGTWVAAAHAGWRGLAGKGGFGVLEATLEAFKPGAQVNSASVATDLIAWLGPCIGPQAFEVGQEVRDAFLQDLQVLRDAALAAAVSACFVPLGQGKHLADLAGLARQRLAALGVTRVFGNDSSPAWCTVGNPSRFFSHRRDRVSGRMAACIWRE